MKPSAFAYYDPDTLEEAVELKHEHGSDAMVLAGGLSLMPLISMRRAHPKVLIDVNRVTELQHVTWANGYLEIGAGVRQHTVEADSAIKESLPLLTEMVSYIGHAEIRNRGTVGGSISYADPATELPCASITFDAEMVIVGPSGTYTVSADDFFTGAMANSLGPDELLAAVRIPVRAVGGYRFVEVSRRVGERPLAAVASHITLDGDRRVVSAAVGLANIADRPVRATALEQALVGQVPTEELIAEATRSIADQVSTGDDIHVTREYRQHAATAIAARSIKAATSHARTGDHQ